jgi:hypothetical protein
MNEQLIAELAYATLLRTGAPTGSREWQKIFAELIVRECIHQCKKDMVSDEEVVEDYDEDWNMALKHGVEQIREHFGVEE